MCVIKKKKNSKSGHLCYSLDIESDRKSNILKNIYKIYKNIVSNGLAHMGKVGI